MFIIAINTRFKTKPKIFLVIQNKTIINIVHHSSIQVLIIQINFQVQYLSTSSLSRSKYFFKYFLIIKFFISHSTFHFGFKKSKLNKNQKIIIQIIIIHIFKTSENSAQFSIKSKKSLKN